MKIKLLFLFLFAAMALNAQEVVFDTIIISKPDSVLFLTHYEKLSDGTVRGRIGGNTVTAPAPDTNSLVNYIVGQMIQKANDHSQKEISRMPLSELTNYMTSNDSLLKKTLEFQAGQLFETLINHIIYPMRLRILRRITHGATLLFNGGGGYFATAARMKMCSF